ncbi:hypothetical protein [Nocardia sp. NPDC019255]|uniref:hypothetical protein n=1 Tax=Nocardia sp. NPDC019255 TaxID=3154591 RepID=UPI0033DE9A43
MDDWGIGAAANHLRAWTTASAEKSTWTAVIEDDAVPVDDITTQAAKALSVAPEPVVSMYLGRGRPIRFQERISRALHRIDERDPHWLTTTHVLHAVAVALHSDLVADWLDWAQDKTQPIDARMTAWCIARGHRVAYCWPSLFEHQDGPSLIPTDSTRPARARTAWRTGTRDTWTSAAMAM